MCSYHCHRRKLIAERCEQGRKPFVQPGSNNESVDLELTESMHEVRVGTQMYKYTSDGKNKHMRVFSVKCKGEAIDLCWRPATFLSVQRKKVWPAHESR